jgi:polyferredoxin
MGTVCHHEEVNMNTVSTRISLAEASQERSLNLLRFASIARLVKWRGFPYVFQAILLAIFLGIAVLGWGHYSPDGVPDKLYAKTNLVNLLIWGLWWPMMVWMAVLFGRLWCTVCPLELVSNVTERLGARLGIRQRSLAKWLRAGWVTLLFYVVIQLLVAGLHIHRVPMYTALFMLSLLTTSAAVGLVMKDRAFCRGFCPVGLLLSTYGRGGMLAVRAGGAEACAGCGGKDCIKSCNRQRLDARSCPSLLNPPKLNSNKDCLVCGQCIKSCQPDNMQLLLRRPFSAADARDPLASWPVTFFVIAVSGFVAYEVSSGWGFIEASFLWFPGQLSDWMGYTEANGWIKGIWAIVGLPLLIWSILGVLTVASGGAKTFGEGLRRLALPMAVVISAAHMAKGLEKFSTWGSFLPNAFRNTDGVETALAIQSGVLTAPAPLIPHAIYAALGVGLLVSGIGFALREARLASTDGASPGLRLGITLLAIAYAACVTGWGFR